MKEYYYIDASNQRIGPVPGETLLSRGINPNTYVWCEDMGSQWSRAGEVAELKPLFAQAPTPPAAPAGTPAAPGGYGAARPGAFPGQTAVQNPGYNPANATQARPAGYGNYNRPQQPGAFNQPQQQPGTFNQPQQPGAFNPPGYNRPQQPAYNQPQQPAYNQPQPGYSQPQPGFPQAPNNLGKPDNGMVWAILTTILCCLPAGVVSIIYASKVDKAWYAGDYAGAQQSAKNAKTWAIVSAAVAALVYVVYFIVIAATTF